MMPKTSLLQRFIDDEIARAPLLMREVIAATLDALRRGEPHSLQVRRQQFELQRPLTQQSALLVGHFVEALRQQVGGTARPSAAMPRATASPWALVDENQIATDVEISRAIEAINNVAESELRELRGYTSAMAGDIEAARDSNPFRPETYVRCLWQAIESLPLTRGYQIAFMHHFAMPLALTLRSSYAAACRRLESQGVEPAAYRTVILPPGNRRGRPDAERHDLSSDMNRLRETMPAPFLDLQLPIPDFGPIEAAPLPAAAPAPSAAEAQLRALVQRLFDAMRADRALPAGLQPLVSALQAPVLQIALHEPGMIDNESHAAWRFIDRLAFAAEVPLFDPAGLGRLLRVAQGLIDHIARAPVQEAALYRWAEDRLSALEQHALQQRRDEAAAVIESLAALEGPIDLGDAASGPAAAGTEALDAGTLDTVPASLLDLTSIDATANNARAAPWVEARQAGDVLRIFMQGHWTAARVLWHSDSGGVWLIAGLPGGASWALRRSALERLWIEGLAHVLSPRSLIHDAAERVLKDLAAPVPQR